MSQPGRQEQQQKQPGEGRSLFGGVECRRHHGSRFRLRIKSANSPTFLAFSTSPTRNRTPNAFSTATISEICVSESHSGTSLALITGVKTTGSRNTVSNMVCNLAMTSAWFIRAAHDLYLGWY